MLPQHPAAVAIFIALFSERRDNRVARRASPREGKSPKKAFNRLFHTLCLKYHSVGTVSVLLLWVFFFGEFIESRGGEASRLATASSYGLWKCSRLAVAC